MITIITIINYIITGIIIIVIIITTIPFIISNKNDICSEKK